MQYIFNQIIEFFSQYFVYILLVAIALFAVIISIHTSKKIRKEKNNRYISDWLLQYMEIKQYKMQVVKEKSLTMADLYYSQIFTAMWIFFKLWLYEHLDEAIAVEVLAERYNDFVTNDYISVVEINPDNSVSVFNVHYQRAWQRYVASIDSKLEYSPFIAFMFMLHSGNVANINKKRRKLRRQNDALLMSNFRLSKNSKPSMASKHKQDLFDQNTEINHREEAIRIKKEAYRDDYEYRVEEKHTSLVEPVLQSQKIYMEEIIIEDVEELSDMQGKRIEETDAIDDAADDDIDAADISEEKDMMLAEEQTQNEEILRSMEHNIAQRAKGINRRKKKIYKYPNTTLVTMAQKMDIRTPYVANESYDINEDVSKKTIENDIIKENNMHIEQIIIHKEQEIHNAETKKEASNEDSFAQLEKELTHMSQKLINSHKLGAPVRSITLSNINDNGISANSSSKVSDIVESPMAIQQDNKSSNNQKDLSGTKISPIKTETKKDNWKTLSVNDLRKKK